jgi:hypothetical protein
MIHVMYRENGILDNIKDQSNAIELEDDALGNRSPHVAMTYAAGELQQFASYNDKT